MSKSLLLIAFLFFYCCVNATDTSGVKLDRTLTKQQTENLYVLVKVWGFLKYHHPDVAKGNSSFDEELFKVMQPIANAASAEKRNELLLNWINSLGDETGYRKAGELPQKDVQIKPNLRWMDDKHLFSDAIINKLNSIYEHRNRSDNAYIKLMPGVLNPNFDGEEKYTSMAGDDDGLRMLGLFRYWNIIEYFYPSKYLIKENWDDVLKEFIPRFAAENNMLAYKLDGREGGMEDGKVKVGDFAYQNDQVLTQGAVCVRSLRSRAA